jgi:hypothetical protein
VTARVRIGTAGWVVVALVTALVVSFLVVKPWQAEAAPGDDDSTFVPITPCRLFDFRAGANNVGPKNTPLGTKVAYTQPVVGTNGRCSIPADAVGVAMNVTIVSPSAQSNLRVYPADAALPATSNLNWLPGQSPTPNKVDVKLSADGKIKLYNHAGTVDVLGDVVGYYSNKSLKELANSVGTVLLSTGALAVAPFDFVTGQLFCPAGSVPVGTGFSTAGSQNFVMIFGTSMGYFLENDFSFVSEVEAQVVCMSGLATTSALTAESVDVSSAMAAYEREVESMMLRRAEG